MGKVCWMCTQLTVSHMQLKRVKSRRVSLCESADTGVGANAAKKSLRLSEVGVSPYMWLHVRLWQKIAAHESLHAVFKYGKFVATHIIIISAVHATVGRWTPQLTPCTSISSHSHPLTATNFLDVVSPFSFWVSLLLAFLLWVSILMLSWPTWCCSLWLHVLPTVLSCTALSLLHLSPLFQILLSHLKSCLSS